MGNKSAKPSKKKPTWDLNKATTSNLPSRPLRHLRFPSNSQGCFSNSARIVYQLGLEHGEEIRCVVFAPDDECTILTTSNPCGPNTYLRADEGMGHFRIFDVPQRKPKKEIITYYSQECDISPDGDLIAFVMNASKGEVAQLKRNRTSPSGVSEKLAKFHPECNGLIGQTMICKFAPDSSALLSAACVDFHTIRETNELRVWSVKSMNLVNSVVLRDLSDFCGFVTSCNFSPDGTLIAFSTSQEQLCVLNSKTLEKVCVVRKKCRGNKCWCVFDPRYRSEVLGCCLQDGRIELWHCDDGHHSSINNELYTCYKQERVTTTSRLYSCQYSPDGNFLAVGTSEAKILLLDSDTLITAMILDCKVQVVSAPNGGMYQSAIIHCLAFSKSCNYLAAGYNDGVVRVWQLPIRFDLKHISRTAILQCVPANKVYSLPLPDPLKIYLLHWPQ
ncbi:WD repeat and SOCS box-containing protein 1 [Exaiptasia diaphana]|uniref:SOCS box domain-containing protein n=1 Tax=Exaiptasia diaphana TaxID=2652724 RepID=A0A913Y5Y8_EXADI|nr:WD repeat and SOCS box-containing protein 1 [Exaiptasia diaphana]KXJ22270.1 WD repeat and SOCS box-containing protein 1 [Exaiptasia diaphana]